MILSTIYSLRIPYKKFVLVAPKLARPWTMPVVLSVVVAGLSEIQALEAAGVAVAENPGDVAVKIK